MSSPESGSETPFSERGSTAPTARADRVEVPGAIVERFFEPDSVAGVAAVVERTAREGRALLIAGGRNRLHWANPVRRLASSGSNRGDFLDGLSTRRLEGIDEFEPEEGVIHALAGTPVRRVADAARAEGWELPLDVPGATSTIGGVIATGATGPRAQVFGRVCDAVLGLEIVGADGVLSKCGGRVVKNVTGYDLAKLYCGSFGSLGIVTGAWLRLRPQPARRAAFKASVAADPVTFESCRKLARIGSVRVCVWDERRDSAGRDACEIYLELAGSEAEVAHDRGQIGAAGAFAEMDWVEIDLAEIDALRERRAEAQGDAVVMRARVLGTRCAELLAMLRDAGLRFEVDAGLGAAHARGALASPSDLLALRARVEELGGILRVEILPEAWREQVEIFGETGEAGRLMAAIKRRFDPQDVLNPGRFGALR